MTKLEVSQEVAHVMGIQLKDAEAAVDATIQAIITGIIKNQKVSIRGLGTWGIPIRKERAFALPKTGEIRQLPEKKVPFFKASNKLKELVAGKV